MSINDRGTTLIDLHSAPEILSVINVWDVISAKAILALPETKALATASHSIAATFGYEDGENIPLELHLDMIGRIVEAAGSVPVSADLEAGYGDAGETVRKAIAVGVVGANLEDQMKPFDEAVAAVSAAVGAAQAEGVPFALNARTDAFVKAGDRPIEDVIADAIARGRAFLDAGATSFFVPGVFPDEVVEQLVAGVGLQKLTMIGIPGAQSSTRLQELGVARISYGPITQRIALTALQDAAIGLYAGGLVDPSTRALN